VSRTDRSDWRRRSAYAAAGYVHQLSRQAQTSDFGLQLGLAGKLATGIARGHKIVDWGLVNRFESLARIANLRRTGDRAFFFFQPTHPALWLLFSMMGVPSDQKVLTGFFCFKLIIVRLHSQVAVEFGEPDKGSRL
jgi:hypothetical protein